MNPHVDRVCVGAMIVFIVGGVSSLFVSAVVSWDPSISEVLRYVGSALIIALACYVIGWACETTGLIETT